MYLHSVYHAILLIPKQSIILIIYYPSSSCTLRIPRFWHDIIYSTNSWRGTHAKCIIIHFKTQLFPLLQGMIFIHDSDLHVHGSLKSSNCVVNSRWTLQVADFGLYELRNSTNNYASDSEHAYFRSEHGYQCLFDTILYACACLFQFGGKHIKNNFCGWGHIIISMSWIYGTIYNVLMLTDGTQETQAVLC